MKMNSYSISHRCESVYVIQTFGYFRFEYYQVGIIQEMGKTKPKTSSQRFAKIYRQFTRIKFTKYKLQYPRIRESEIIAKIIKEWQAMDENAKQDLAQQYIQKTGKDFLEDLSSSEKNETLDKKQQKKSSDPMSISARAARRIGKSKKGRKKKKKSPVVRVFKQKVTTSQKLGVDSKGKSSQNSKTPGKKSTPQKKQTSSSELALQGAKKIYKTFVRTKSKSRSQNQWLSFFKYYYDRLRSQHPRWSNEQLATIIKLLWRRKSKRDDRKTQKPKKGLTGLQLYNKTKKSQGFLRQQIRQLWRALPHQSKRYWQIKGQGLPHRSIKDSGLFVRKVLKLGSAKPETLTSSDSKTSFIWLNQTFI